MNGHPHDKARLKRIRSMAKTAPTTLWLPPDEVEWLLDREEAERAGRERAEAALREIADGHLYDGRAIARAVLSAREPGNNKEGEQ